MTDRPTPETDSAEMPIDRIDTVASRPSCVVISDFARKLERERDEAREAAEKAKAFKRVLKEDNAKLRSELDKSKNDADAFIEKWGKSQEQAINAERKLDELNKRLIEASQRSIDLLIERDDHRFLLREIFNLTQIGDPHPADLPMKALQAIAEMIDEHLKEVRK